jgi:hypothetical protein
VPLNHFKSTDLTIYNRCLAFARDLDHGPRGDLRSREHTDALVDLIEFGILWDEYGIIGELVVRFCQMCTASTLLMIELCHSPSPTIFLVRTSISSSLPTSYTSLSREPSRITLWNGWVNTWNSCMEKQVQRRSWMILTEGALIHCHYLQRKLTLHILELL